MARSRLACDGALSHEESLVSESQRIIALGLLTARDLEILGSNFKRAYPIEHTPCFGELLLAIDEADREIRNARNPADKR